MTFPDYSPGPAYQVASNLKKDGGGERQGEYRRLRRTRAASPDYGYVYAPYSIWSESSYNYFGLQQLGHLLQPREPS